MSPDNVLYAKSGMKKIKIETKNILLSCSSANKKKENQTRVKIFPLNRSSAKFRKQEIKDSNKKYDSLAINEKSAKNTQSKIHTKQNKRSSSEESD